MDLHDPRQDIERQVERKILLEQATSAATPKEAKIIRFLADGFALHEAARFLKMPKTVVSVYIRKKQAGSYGSLFMLTMLCSVTALIIISSLTYLGRVFQNLPAKRVFTENECRILYHAANKTREKITEINFATKGR